MSETIPLPWAEKFREIVEGEGDPHQIVIKFYEYCNEQEKEFNERIRGEGK